MAKKKSGIVIDLSKYGLTEEEFQRARHNYAQASIALKEQREAERGTPYGGNPAYNGSGGEDPTRKLQEEAEKRSQEEMKRQQEEASRRQGYDLNKTDAVLKGRYQQTKQETAKEKQQKANKQDTLNALQAYPSLDGNRNMYQDSVLQQERQIEEAKKKNLTRTSAQELAHAKGFLDTNLDPKSYRARQLFENYVYEMETKGLFGKGNVDERFLRDRGYTGTSFTEDEGIEQTKWFGDTISNGTQRRSAKDLKKEIQSLTGLDEKGFQQYAENAQVVFDADYAQWQRENAAKRVNTGSRLKDLGGSLANTATSIIEDTIASVPRMVGQMRETEKARYYQDPLAPVNVNAPGFRGANESTFLEEQTQEAIQNRYGRVAAEAYGIGSSMARSAGTGAAFGMLGAAGGLMAPIAAIGQTAAFSGGAYNQTARAAAERGLTAEQTQLVASGAAVFEALFEELSLEKLDDIYKTAGKKGLKNNILKTMAKQGLFEGTEEINTEIANKIMDYVIAGDRSEFAQTEEAYYQNYINQGMDEETARKAARGSAIKDAMLDIGMAGLGGAISGIGLGGGAHILGSLVAKENGKAMVESEGGIQGVKDKINSVKLESPEANEHAQRASEIADTIQKKEESGEKVNSKDYKALYEAVRDADEAENAYADNPKTTAEKWAEEDKETARGESVEGQTGERDTSDRVRINDSDYEVPEHYRTEKTTDTAKEVAEKLTEASKEKSPKALVEAYKESQTSEDAETRKTGEDMYAMLSRKMISDGTTTRDQFDRLESVASPEEAFRAGAENREINNLDDQTMIAYNEGKMARIEAKAQRVREARDSIGKLQVSESGEVTYDGKKLSEIEDSETRNLALAAQTKTSAREAEAFINIYQEEAAGRPVKTFERAWDVFVRAGVSEADLSTVMERNKSLKAQFDEKTLERIYKIGQEISEDVETDLFDGETLKEDITEAEPVTKGRKKGTGAVTYNDEAKHVKKKFGKVLQMFAEATGLDIEVEYNKGSEENGRFVASEGKIYLNAASRRMFQTLFHEGIGEFMEEYNPEGMKNVRDAIGKYIIKKKGKDFVKKKVSEYRYAYRDFGKTKGYENEATKSSREAMNEFLNDQIWELFSTEEGMQDFIDWMEGERWDKKISVLDTISSMIKKASDLINQMKKMLDLSSALNRSFVDDLDTELERMEKVRNTIFEELEKAKENYQNAAETDGETEQKFSLSEPVEEDDKLIVLHNIFENKLEKQLELEGMPMPSLAVTKQSIGHKNFGPISFLFHKDTIDPKKDKRNKGYSADAWTPTFPVTQYAVNEKKSEEIRRRVMAIDPERIPEMYRRDASMLLRIDDYELTNKGGEEGYIERVKDSDALKAMYISEKGGQIKETKKITREERDPAKGKIYSKILNAMENPDAEEKASLNDLYSKYGDVTREALAERMMEVNGWSKEEAMERANNMPKLRITTFISNAIRTRNDGGVKIKEETDFDDMRKQIADQVDLDDYDRWLHELFKGIEGKKGLRNSKDLFTPSGKRRSFDQLHMPVTVENIVKAMMQDGEKNVATVVNAKTLRAETSKTFKSLEEAKKASEKMKDIDTDQYQEELDRINNRLNKVWAEVAEGHSGNQWLIMDEIGSIMAEAAQKPTKANVLKAFKPYAFNVTAAQAQEMADIMKEIADMTVNMFEFKPQRVVGYNEIVKAFVPSDMSQSLKDKLTQRGIEFEEYERDNEDQRREMINRVANSVPGARFSLRVGDREVDYLGDIMTIEQHKRFMSEIDTKRKSKFTKAKNGDAIIPIDNMLVYTDFNKKDPGISKIIYFGTDDYTKIDGATEWVHRVEKGELDYEQMRRIVEGFGIEEGIGIYSNDMFGYSERYDRQAERGKRRSDAYHARKQQERRGFRFDDNGNEIKFSINTDSEGRKLSDEQQSYFKDSQVVDENGNLRVVYHGTNYDRFTTFDYDETGKVDGGFFGRGFYFAFSKGEAEMYGRNVIPAYLNIKNPFVFDEELYLLDGERVDGYDESNAVFIMNLADKVPEIAEKYTIDTWPENGDFPEEFTFARLKEEYEKYLSNDGLQAIEIEDSDGTHFEWTMPSDDEWDYYKYDPGYNEYKTKEEAEKHRKEAAIRFMLKDWGIIDLHGGSYYIESYGDEFTHALIDRGYDGVLQTRDGDEAVAFYPNQIKDVDNQNPTDHPDIRFSLEIPDSKFSVYDYGFEIFEEMDDQDYSDVLIADENYMPNIQKESREEAASILERGAKAAKGQPLSKKRIYEMAKGYKDHYNSSFSAKTLADNMEKLFQYITETGVVNHEDMLQIMKEVAMPVIENTVASKDEREIYDDFRRVVSGYRIRLNDQQKQEVKSKFGSVSNWVRATGAILSVNDKEGQSLDSVWVEMAERTNGILNPYMDDADQPIALADAFNALVPCGKTAAAEAYGLNPDDMAHDLALQMVTDFFGEKDASVKKDVDKLQKDYKDKVKEQYEKKLKKEKEKLRDQYNKRLDNALSAQQKSLREDYAYLDQKYRDDEAAKKKRDEAIAKAKAKVRQTFQDRADRQDAKKIRGEIESGVNRLREWITNPTEKNHVPASVAGPIAEFLSAFDFITPELKYYNKGKHEGMYGAYVYQFKDKNDRPVYRFIGHENREQAFQLLNEHIYDQLQKGDGSARRKTWQEKMRGLQAFLDAVRDDTASELLDKGNGGAGEFGSFETLIDNGLAAELRGLLENNDRLPAVSMLTSQELRTLNKILKNLAAAINRQNQFFTNSRYETISEAAQSHINGMFAKKEHKAKGKLYNAAWHLLNVSMITPSTYFHMIGADDIYESIRSGMNKRTENIRKAETYTTELLKDVKGIPKWKKEIKTVKDLNGKEMKLTTVQIMSLYLLKKRPQAAQHFVGGFYTEKLDGRDINSNKAPYYLSNEMIDDLTNGLTEEQRRVADGLQKYLAEDCANQGNEVTEALYGYKKFGDPRYFPMRVWDNNLKTDDKGLSQDLFNAITNSGFTKATKKMAKNSLILEDIFEVYTRHVTQMATYNGYALPTSDMLRWFNYKESVKKDNGTIDTHFNVKNAISYMGGKDYINYFKNLYKDVNGEGSASEEAGLAKAAISRYKAAAVGANFRVAIQQPTAYPRAMALLGPKYMMKALVGNPLKLPANARYAQENNSIAYWKSKGYYDNSMGQSLEQIITGESTVMDKIRDYTGILSQWGDDWTWGMLYKAVEYEQQDKHKGMDFKSQEFRDLVNKRMDDVVDQTQVVDSVLHRSQFMRSKDTGPVIESAFQAEPTKTYNMLYRAIMDGDKKNIARTGMVFVMTTALCAAAASVMDAERSDEDKDPFRKWLEAMFGLTGEEKGPIQVARGLMGGNLGSGLNVLSMIPYVKNIFSLLDGFDVERTDMVAISNVMKSANQTMKYIQGGGTKSAYGVSRNVVKAVSQLTGIPAFGLWREVEGIHNMFFDSWRTQKLGKYDELYEAIGEYVEIPEEPKEEVDNKDDLKVVKDKIKQAEKAGDELTAGVMKSIYLNMVDDGKYDVTLGSAKERTQDAIKSHYKNQYISMYESKDPNIKTLKEQVTNALKAAELPDEKIDELFEKKWFPTLPYADMGAAVREGKGGPEIEKVRTELMNRGKTEKEANSAITSKLTEQFKEAYKQDAMDSKMEQNFKYAYKTVGVEDTDKKIKEVTRLAIKDKYKDEYLKAKKAGQAYHLWDVIVTKLEKTGLTTEKARETVQNWS